MSAIRREQQFRASGQAISQKEIEVRAPDVSTAILEAARTE